MLTQRNVALVAFAVALIPISIGAYFVHRDITATPAELTPTGHAYGGYAVGDDRFATLNKITKTYVAQNADASADMREGKALAPLAFINEQLELEGLRWRVRHVNGLVADIYDVS